MSKIRKQHMTIHWHDIVQSDNSVPATEATLKEKATLVGRIGLMMLSVGTGAWRVRNSMNKVSRCLDISCSADIGLLSIECTCIDENHTYTQSLSLPTTGVNTDKLTELELFMRDFPEKADTLSVMQFHEVLDHIQGKKANYKAWNLGLASAIACCAFTFLLGGGPIEMICAFFGAGVGNFVRKLMLNRKISLFGNVAVSVAASCAVYVITILLAQNLLHVSAEHQAGYICAMLFVIPGFPLITGGIDLAKLDMRSGLERISYAILIITVATMTGWATAMLFRFQPADFQPLEIQTGTMILLRIAASFFGVYGFSLMFNSPRKMAFTAGLIGMFANTLRLELIDLAGFPVGIAAFLGAFCSGCIASVVKKKIGFPRISLTVPAIVIMVPGLYMYRGIYYMGLSNVADGSIWLTKAILIVVALPLGLVAARLCTDSNFRHCT
ncbi:threonine/serine exporter family protein [uncultured Ruminococcus sp.]|uniref:threonine/serine ThrE exporter family protein n=1 Tax=uncultured Ruminococcus sp. TaxID=165186 RepID=UPI0025F04CE1|nr:threonine/serine exporter family protein [uncultured Ruminococcus sp.]